MKALSPNDLPEDFSDDLKAKIISAARRLDCGDTPGVIQTSEDYNITVDDENWVAGAPLMRCPSWFANIQKSVPLTDLYFLAASPDIDYSDEYLEEHIFLELPGWKQVADDYPFFVELMHTSGHYPIASSGFGYLVIGADSSPKDPIYRWDGSGMNFKEAFKDFESLLDSAVAIG